MKVLIYKRTHKGDPDIHGVFGNHDCMGRVRDWNYEAVIGIGGKSPWKEDKDIKYKINWIGIGPKKIGETNRGHRIVFSNFALFEENGRDIKGSFPNLFEYMYGSRKRFDMKAELPQEVLNEVIQIIDSARNSPKSLDYDTINFDSKSENDYSSEIKKCSGCYGGKNVEVEIETCVSK